MLGDSPLGLGIIVLAFAYAALRFLQYTVRKEAEKLAATEPKAPPLRVPVIQDLPRICKTCQHFSKEEWQSAMAAHPLFAEATRWVSPNAMGAPVQRDEEGKPLEGVPDGAGPLNLKQNHWNCFAVCTKEGAPNYAKGLHQDDSCEQWEAPDAA